MKYVLEITVEMIVLITTKELNAFLEKNYSTQEKIYLIISFKHFVDTTNEHVIEHQFDYSIMFVFNHFIIFDIFYVNLIDLSIVFVFQIGCVHLLYKNEIENLAVVKMADFLYFYEGVGD